MHSCDCWGGENEILTLKLGCNFLLGSLHYSEWSLGDSPKLRTTSIFLRKLVDSPRLMTPAKEQVAVMSGSAFGQFQIVHQLCSYLDHVTLCTVICALDIFWITSMCSIWGYLEVYWMLYLGAQCSGAHSSGAPGVSHITLLLLELH